MDDALFSAMALQKLTLADAVWRTLHFTFDDVWLDDLWERFRGRCYEKSLSFKTLTGLIADALLKYDGSGRRAFEHAREGGTLPVVYSSAYAKLGNLPLAVSEAFLEEGARRLHDLLPANHAVTTLPACWKGYDLFGLDGKAIKHVNRLLKPLRGLQAGILGGRASVALNLRTGLAVAMVGNLDGEAGEGVLTEVLLGKVAAAAGDRPWLVVLDRLYCNLKFPPLILKAGGHFVIRYCSNTEFVPDPNRPAKEGRDAKGQRFVQEWGWLGKVDGPRRVSVRRITLFPPDGNEIGVVTDLEDEVTYPAEDILETYRKRWGIERVFHEITDVFSLKHLIATTPQATLFQLSFCLLLYNTVQVVRAHLAFHQECVAENISNEKLFNEIHEELIAIEKTVGQPRLIELLGEVPTAKALREHLSERLRGTWSDRWWKSQSKGGGGHQKVKTRVLGNHTSTYRVLQQALEQKKKPAKSL
jgi:Transposase DDE domain